MSDSYDYYLNNEMYGSIRCRHTSTSFLYYFAQFKQYSARVPREGVSFEKIMYFLKAPALDWN